MISGQVAASCGLFQRIETVFFTADYRSQVQYEVLTKSDTRYIGVQSFKLLPPFFQTVDDVCQGHWVHEPTADECSTRVGSETFSASPTTLHSGSFWWFINLLFRLWLDTTGNPPGMGTRGQESSRGHQSTGFVTCRRCVQLVVGLLFVGTRLLLRIYPMFSVYGGKKSTGLRSRR